MNTYRVDSLAGKTSILSVFVRTLLAGAVAWPHKASLMTLVGLAVFVSGMVFLSPLYRGGAFDLEIDDYGIRKVKSNQVDLAILRESIRFAKQVGWGRYRRLTVSERGPLLAWLQVGVINIPATMPEYDQIRDRILGWIDHRGSAPMVSLCH